MVVLGSIFLFSFGSLVVVNSTSPLCIGIFMRGHLPVIRSFLSIFCVFFYMNCRCTDAIALEKKLDVYISLYPVHCAPSCPLLG